MKNELEKLITSNAKAIEAIANALAQEREERKKSYKKWEKDRHNLYKYLSRIASAQSNFYEVQADYYEQLSMLSERQTKIEERQVQMQEQIISILNKISDASDSSKL